MRASSFYGRRRSLFFGPQSFARVIQAVEKLVFEKAKGHACHGRTSVRGSDRFSHTASHKRVIRSVFGVAVPGKPSWRVEIPFTAPAAYRFDRAPCKVLEPARNTHRSVLATNSCSIKSSQHLHKDAYREIRVAARTITSGENNRQGISLAGLRPRISMMPFPIEIRTGAVTCRYLNRLVAFDRSDLREWGFMQTPPMPSYSGTLNPDELADVLAYLASLKGVSHP